MKREKLSNKKKKGSGNSKNGNRYLSWAYVEATNAEIRSSHAAQRFYNLKASATNPIIDRQALAKKLARASFYTMRDQVANDERKMFAC